MRMLVVGAGSTGGYFGGRLAAAGKDVTFLVRPARAEQLRRTGLQIVSPAGDLLINPKLLAAGEISAPFDIVLLTVKAFSLAATVEDFAPAVGPNTVILPVLNGMKHMNVLSARFCAERLAGCVCKIATVLDQEGRIAHLAPFHDLSYGERDGALSDRMAAIERVHERGGLRRAPVVLDRTGNVGEVDSSGFAWGDQLPDAPGLSVISPQHPEVLSLPQACSTRPSRPCAQSGPHRAMRLWLPPGTSSRGRDRRRHRPCTAT